MAHNEEPLAAEAVRQALEAARPGDRIWFVDSASSDGSAGVARSLGVEVMPAPLGKGQAMTAVLERCRSGLVCFLDADIAESSSNIPRVLRDAVDAGGEDMVVGEFDWPAKPFSGAQSGIYRPLVADLFPDAVHIAPKTPFSGFRILDTALGIRRLPPRWGPETYLNLLLTATGRTVGTAYLGVYDGPQRLKAVDLGNDSAAVILDMAERHGRLDRGLRPAWEEWVASMVEVLSTQPGAGEPVGDYVERLAEAAGRPRPPARVALAAD
jgi:glucosyl-3-phosphoglycerate synthase